MYSWVTTYTASVTYVNTYRLHGSKLFEQIRQKKLSTEEETVSTVRAGERHETQPPD